MDTNETRQDPIEMLLKYLEYGQDPATRSLYEARCMSFEHIYNTQK